MSLSESASAAAIWTGGSATVFNVYMPIEIVEAGDEGLFGTLKLSLVKMKRGPAGAWIDAFILKIKHGHGLVTIWSQAPLWSQKRTKNKPTITAASQ